MTVDFGSSIIGVQNVHWDMGVDYATEIGPSRTFCFFHEIEYLYRNNLIKGGDLDNAIVIVEQEATEEQLKWVSQLFSLPGQQHHTDGDSFPVAVRIKTESFFHRMSQCMSEVQQHSFAGIKFIMLYDTGFYIAAGFDNLIPVGQQIPVILQRLHGHTAGDAAIAERDLGGLRRERRLRCASPGHRYNRI